MRPQIVLAFTFASLWLPAVGCSSDQPKPEAGGKMQSATDTLGNRMTLSSPAFSDGERIPSKHTCTGANLSPELKWEHPPEGTVAFALICHDPDAPVGDWVHWVIYDLPGETRGLPEGVSDTPDLDSGAKQGRTDFGSIGYGGPCPPPGKPHHYLFELYALSGKSGLEAGAGREKLLETIKLLILSEAVLTGVYSR